MSEPDRYRKQVEKTVAFLRGRLQTLPEVVIQLGTGLGGVIDGLDMEARFAYGEIPGFPRSTVPSHDGYLSCGLLEGKKVAVFQGRFHYYEGYSARQVALPIRALSLLGATTAIITNASGGLNPSFEPGTIMVFADHLNFLGDNPLRGPNIEEWGPRFPDFSTPYDTRLRQLALTCAENLGMRDVRSGVYVCIPGPSLETPAETRFLRAAGADAVGMSSIPEILVAVHGGMRVLGLSVVANVNNPDDLQPIILEDIIACAQKAGSRLETLITHILHQL